MKVKINSDSDVYKAILTTNWTSVSPDDAVLAWVVNQALTSAGHPRMFDIDDTADSDALVVLTPAPDHIGVTWMPLTSCTPMST